MEQRIHLLPTNVLQPAGNAALSAGRNGQRVTIASSRSATVKVTRHAWSSKTHWVLSALLEGLHSKVMAYSISMRQGKMELQGNMDVSKQPQVAKLHYLRSGHVRPRMMGSLSLLL